MRKVVPFLLLFIFLFNTMGYFIVFKCSRFYIKETVENAIEDGVDAQFLTSITVQKNEIHELEWTDENEFRYKNDFFDVFKKVEHVSAVTYYCLDDTKERNLVSALDEHILKNVIGDKPLKNNSEKSPNLYESIKLFIHDIFVLSPVVHSYSPICYAYFHPHYSFALVKPNDQPPEFI